jgi:hypothetical protein
MIDIDWLIFIFIFIFIYLFRVGTVSFLTYSMMVL